MPCGLKWCELFLILYRTPFPTELKVNKADAVTVCLFRIFTIEQILLNPVTVAKHSVVLTAKSMAHRKQILQRATMLK